MKENNKHSREDIIEYIEHCKSHYLSHYNDGYTRDYYRNELLRLKDILNETLNGKDTK
jgi:hypothetical protein